MIKCKVDDYIDLDSDIAGKEGEANVTEMEFEFSPSWDNFAKRISFLDARGTNKVGKILSSNTILIPGEALKYSGRIHIVADGLQGNKVKKSITRKMTVLPSMTPATSPPSPPTPDQALQLQESIQAEATARTNSDNSLAQAISDEANTRGQADTALNQAILSEAEARAQADLLLQPKEAGKGLSTNDYDNAEKAEVAKVKDKADKSDTYTKLEVDTEKVDKTDIVTDFTGGVGKVAGAEETKQLKAKIYYERVPTGTIESPVDLSTLLENKIYVIDGYVKSLSGSATENRGLIILQVQSNAYFVLQFYISSGIQFISRAWSPLEEVPEFSINAYTFAEDVPNIVRYVDLIGLFEIEALAEVIGEDDNVLLAFKKLQLQLSAILASKNQPDGVAGTGADSRISIAQLPQNLISSTMYEAPWLIGTLSVSGSVFTLAGHPFADGDPVEFRAIAPAVLPTGILPFNSDNIGGAYYNITKLTNDTFEIYSDVARTVKVTPSDVGTAGYQVRLAGVPNFDILGLDGNRDNNYLIVLSNYSMARKTNESLRHYLRLNNSSAYKYTNSGEALTGYTVNAGYLDAITGANSKYMISTLSINATRGFNGNYTLTSSFKGKSSDDKSTATIILSDGFSIVRDVTANLTSIRFVAIQGIRGIFRNGIVANVWRLN